MVYRPDCSPTKSLGSLPGRFGDSRQEIIDSATPRGSRGVGCWPMMRIMSPQGCVLNEVSLNQIEIKFISDFLI